MTSNKARFIAAASTMALAAAAPAQGQAASGNSSTPTAANEQAAAETSSGIADIVVTAQKRSENLQKTPAAITAFAGLALTEKGVTNLAAAQELVPGARFHQEGNTTQVFLRGVGSNLDFANVQPSVAFNFNGVFIPREATSISLYDVERFEVLPGPQGTLYGRSAIGGTVNVSFNRPVFKDTLSANLDVGSYNLVHPTVVGNFKVSDKLAVRAAIDYVYRDGYMATDSDSQNDLSGRLSALYEPNDRVTVYAWGYTAQKYGHTPNLVNKGSRATFDATGALTGFVYDENAFLRPNPYDDLRPGPLASTAIFGQPTTSTQSYNNWAVGAQLDVKLGDHFTLTYIPGYVFLNTITNVYWLGVLPAYNHPKYQETTHELRIAGDIGRLNLLGGLYGYRTVQSGQAIVGTSVGPGGPAIPGTPFPFYSSHVLRNRIQGAAIFGQATYRLTDALRLTLGGRYGVDQTDANGISVEDQVTPYTFDHTFHRFDYKAGAQYDLTSRMMVYVQYQTGYQPGTFNEVASVPGRDNLVKTGTLRSVAAGFKSRFFDNTLQINDEIFYSVYKGLAIQAYDASKLYNPIFNANRVTIPGNQLDILWQPTSADRLNLSVSYIKSRNKDFVTPDGVSFNGLAGPYAADWTINGGISHDFQMHLGYVRAAVDGRYESTWWADFVHNKGTRQDPYAKINAELIYYSENGDWSFGFWGRNLTNKAVIAATAAAGIPGPATAFLDSPRTYGIRAGRKF